MEPNVPTQEQRFEASRLLREQRRHIVERRRRQLQPRTSIVNINSQPSNNNPQTLPSLWNISNSARLPTTNTLRTPTTSQSLYQRQRLNLASYNNLLRNMEDQFDIIRNRDNNSNPTSANNIRDTTLAGVNEDGGSEVSDVSSSSSDTVTNQTIHLRTINNNNSTDDLTSRNVATRNVEEERIISNSLNDFFRIHSDLHLNVPDYNDNDNNNNIDDDNDKEINSKKRKRKNLENLLNNFKTKRQSIYYKNLNLNLNNTIDFCSFLIPGITYNLLSTTTNSNLNSNSFKFIFNQVNYKTRKIHCSGNTTNQFLMRYYLSSGQSSHQLFHAFDFDRGSRTAVKKSEVTFDLTGTIIDFVNDDLRWITSSKNSNSESSSLSIGTSTITGNSYTRRTRKDINIETYDLIFQQIEIWKNIEPFNKYKDLKSLINDLTNLSKIKEILSNYIFIKFNFLNVKELKETSNDIYNEIVNKDVNDLKNSILFFSIRRSDGNSSSYLLNENIGLTKDHHNYSLNQVTGRYTSRSAIRRLYEETRGMDDDIDMDDNGIKGNLTMIPCNGTPYYNQSIEMR